MPQKKGLTSRVYRYGPIILDQIVELRRPLKASVYLQSPHYNTWCMTSEDKHILQLKMLIISGMRHMHKLS